MAGNIKTQKDANNVVLHVVANRVSFSSGRRKYVKTSAPLSNQNPSQPPDLKRNWIKPNKRVFHVNLNSDLLFPCKLEGK